MILVSSRQAGSGELWVKGRSIYGNTVAGYRKVMWVLGVLVDSG